MDNQHQDPRHNENAKVLMVYPTTSKDGAYPENRFGPAEEPDRHGLYRLFLRDLSSRQHSNIDQYHHHDIAKLAESFSLNGAVTPECFNPPQMPSESTVKTELQNLLNAHPCI